MLDKINFLKVITSLVISVTAHLLGTFQGIAAVSVTFQHQICILAKELCYLEEKTPRNALKIRQIHIDPELKKRKKKNSKLKFCSPRKSLETVLNIRCHF